MDLITRVYEGVGVVSYSLLVFLLVINILVFVHEMGHFLLARINGVKVEAFSIGFGGEIFGWNDSHGTRWKIALYPLGGYVQMYGDADAASTPDNKKAKLMSEEEKKVSFYHKSVWQKISIIIAGPLFNYLFAFVAVVFLHVNYGKNIVVDESVIGAVIKGGPADVAGLKTGDVVLSIDGKDVSTFSEMLEIISAKPGAELSFVVDRKGKRLLLNIRTDSVKVGGKNVGRINVSVSSIKEKTDFYGAVISAFDYCVNFNKNMISHIAYMFENREASGLSGPIGIAHISGKMNIFNIEQMLYFMVMLSLSLGFLNLLPIPMLDGGHLLFYLIEGIKGSPVSERFQDWFFRIGLGFILFLFLIGMRNDLSRLFGF